MRINPRQIADRQAAPAFSQLDERKILLFQSQISIRAFIIQIEFQQL